VLSVGICQIPAFASAAAQARHLRIDRARREASKCALQSLNAGSLKMTRENIPLYH
jgi:hypothetical protein